MGSKATKTRKSKKINPSLVRDEEGSDFQRLLSSENESTNTIIGTQTGVSREQSPQFGEYLPRTVSQTPNEIESRVRNELENMSRPENPVNIGEILATNNRDQYASLSNEFQGNIEMLS